MRRLLFVLLAGVTTSAIAVGAARDSRATAIARAHVWEATNIPSKDLRSGPAGEKAFKFLETVTCKYDNKKLPGKTPKFACKIDPNDDLKVKYGGNNGEVYAEVAATRLLWALGFGADAQVLRQGRVSWLSHRSGRHHPQPTGKCRRSGDDRAQDAWRAVRTRRHLGLG